MVMGNHRGLKRKTREGMNGLAGTVALGPQKGIRGFKVGKGERERPIPCLRDNDVVEGSFAFAEAGKADLDDHYIAYGGWPACVRGGENVVKVSCASCAVDVERVSDLATLFFSSRLPVMDCIETSVRV